MALISCPECNNQVSSTAATCPKCGAPIVEATGSRAAGAPLNTIQETGKRLKVHIIFSSVMFWAGVVWIFVVANDAPQDGEPSVIPAMLLFIGIIWYVITKFRIWWHHK